jgi:cytochrome c553
MSVKRVSIAAAALVASVLVASVFSVALVPPAYAGDAAPAGAASCSGCHAASPGVVTPVPRLAGLGAAEMVRAMQEFRAGARPATVMDRIARGFSDDEVRAIAAWLALQR